MKDRLKGLALSETGFLFDPVTGHMYTLNSVGRMIVERLREGVAPSALADAVSERFNVETDEAARDCESFLQKLKEYQLV